MSLFSQVVQKIDRGKQGLNEGLPMGFDRLVEHVPNIQQGTYYLVGGDTGTGKTAFVDDCFLYNPYDWLSSNKDKTNIKFKVIYLSFEIDKLIKITKGICRYIYIHYGMKVDVNYVLSRGKNLISQEVYDIVMSTREYFEQLEDVLDIYDMANHPTGINAMINKYAEQNGKFEQLTEYKRIYIPNDPNLYTIIVFDHISLMRKEKGYDTKQNIDKMSEYLVGIRNNYNFIPVVVQQLSRSMTAVDRFKLERVEPQLGDFKSSGNTQEDANVVMALFSPMRYKLETFLNYKTPKLRDRLRTLHLLKNRDGAADLAIGLKFVGEVGHFSELKKADEMSEDDYKKAVE